MNYTALVKYSNFVEKYEVMLDQSNLTLNLLGVLPAETTKQKEELELDLSKNFTQAYSVFPYQEGDLCIVQNHKEVYFGFHFDGVMHWSNFSVQEIHDYIFSSNLFHSVIKFFDEDNNIFLNSLLNDFVRNDYTRSQLNIKIKYIKVAVLLEFIRTKLLHAVNRVVVDETVIGDVEVDEIGTAFRFVNEKMLKAMKISSTTKILALLKQEGIVAQSFHFIEDFTLLNMPNNGDKLKIVFSDNGVKFDYQVMQGKNYVFELENKYYGINVGNLFKDQVRRKVIVFNGDERDLMLILNKNA